MREVDGVVERELFELDDLTLREAERSPADVLSKAVLVLQRAGEHFF